MEVQEIKKSFIRFIRLVQSQRRDIIKLEQLLHCSVFEAPLYQRFDIMGSLYLEAIFNEEGVDTIYWWLYEKSENPSLKMYDSENKEIPTETVDDLWNYVKDYLK